MLNVISTIKLEIPKNVNLKKKMLKFGSYFNELPYFQKDSNLYRTICVYKIYI